MIQFWIVIAIGAALIGAGVSVVGQSLRPAPSPTPDTVLLYDTKFKTVKEVKLKDVAKDVADSLEPPSPTPRVITIPDWNTICVPYNSHVLLIREFTNLDAALANAQKGDTVYLPNGTYIHK